MNPDQLGQYMARYGLEKYCPPGSIPSAEDQLLIQCFGSLRPYIAGVPNVIFRSSWESFLQCEEVAGHQAACLGCTEILVPPGCALIPDGGDLGQWRSPQARDVLRHHLEHSAFSSESYKYIRNDIESLDLMDRVGALDPLDDSELANCIEECGWIYWSLGNESGMAALVASKVRQDVVTQMRLWFDSTSGAYAEIQSRGDRAYWVSRGGAA